MLITFSDKLGVQRPLRQLSPRTAGILAAVLPSAKQRPDPVRSAGV